MCVVLKRQKEKKEKRKEIDIQKELYCKVLNHMIMEPEKSHHLLSASRRVSGEVQRPGSWKTDAMESTYSESNGLRGRSLWQEEAGVPAQVLQAFFQRLGGFPLTLGRAICFTQSSNSSAKLFQKHLHRLPEVIFNQKSGLPGSRSSGHIKRS